MIVAAPPPNEDRRLEALRALLILDTPPEERFDRIVQFAADEFDMPIVLFSLVDQKRQWFKARVGLTVCETEREVSFCSHAIAGDGLFIVPDATNDPRFFDNPLVTGESGIRFYAGMPLVLEGGEAIGTLCLIDRQPRTLDEIDRVLLRALASLLLEALGEREAEAGRLA